MYENVVAAVHLFIYFFLLNKLREQKWNRLNCVSVSCNTGFRICLFILLSREFDCKQKISSVPLRLCYFTHEKEKNHRKRKTTKSKSTKSCKKKMERYIFQSDSIHVIRQNIDILQTTNS